MEDYRMNWDGVLQYFSRKYEYKEIREEGNFYLDIKNKKNDKNVKIHIRLLYRNPDSEVVIYLYEKNGDYYNSKELKPMDVELILM